MADRQHPEQDNESVAAECWLHPLDRSSCPGEAATLAGRTVIFWHYGGDFAILILLLRLCVRAANRPKRVGLCPWGVVARYGVVFTVSYRTF